MTHPLLLALARAEAAAYRASEGVTGAHPDDPPSGDTMTLRPFFTFYGGKYRAAPHYPDPQFGTIVEPFAGAAGYSVRHHARRVILVERDPNVAATWRYLLRVSPAEVLALPDLAPGQSVDDLAVCPEARLLIGWWLNKGCAGPRRSPGAWMRSGMRPTAFWCTEIRQRLAAQVEHIRHWTLIEGTYCDAPDIEATWFIDPPYAVAGKHYRFGSSTIDYNDLADFCRERQGQVMVCENEGATWLPFRPFRAIKASEGKNGGKVSREALWTPDDPPHPAMLAHRLRGEWQRAGCPVEVEGPARRPDIMPYSKP